MPGQENKQFSWDRGLKWLAVLGAVVAGLAAFQSNVGALWAGMMDWLGYGPVSLHIRDVKPGVLSGADWSVTADGSRVFDIEFVLDKTGSAAVRGCKGELQLRVGQPIVGDRPRPQDAFPDSFEPNRSFEVGRTAPASQALSMRFQFPPEFRSDKTDPKLFKDESADFQLLCSGVISNKEGVTLPFQSRG